MTKSAGKNTTSVTKDRGISTNEIGYKTYDTAEPSKKHGWRATDNAVPENGLP